MKKTASLVVLCAAILALSGCGISRQQYDDVCGERDALLAELQAMQGSVPPEAAGSMVSVRIGGSFTATVRSLIPDYVTDSTTPQVAVVTLFQSGPFALHVGDLAEQLEPGMSYVFTVEEKQVEMTGAEYAEGAGFAEEMISRYRLRISDVRLAEENETGLDADNLVMRLDEK